MKIRHMAGMIVLAMAAGTFARGQTSNTVKDDLFAGTEIFAKGASDVTEVTMDPDTLGMVGGKDKGRASRMVLNVVRTYEYDKPGMYNIADVDAFRNKLNSGDWHCSVHTRSLKTGESTDVCNKRRTDDMVESAIITVEPKELTFIHTIRKRSMNESSFEGGDAMIIMPDIAGMGPEMQAQMAITKAQMGAMMARMRAEGVLQSAELGPEFMLHMDKLISEDSLKGIADALKDIKPMDEKQLQELKDSTKKALKDAKPLQ